MVTGTQNGFQGDHTGTKFDAVKTMALFVLRCGERDRFYRSVTGLVRVSRLTDHTVQRVMG